MFTAADVAAIGEIRQDDILIAFMGPTGVGKSTFIDLLAGGVNTRAGSSLRSHTAKVEAVCVTGGHPKYGAGTGRRIVFIDTPGFDDTSRSDMQILEMIGKWLETVYRKEVKLAGLIYLHRITDNRMAGSPLRNLRTFGGLCGDVAMNQVMLVTTMWEKLNENTNVGYSREKELVDKFWQPMIARGSKVERLSRASPDEAWRVINRIIALKNERHAVLLQEELVALELRLNETQAGKMLYNSLQRLLWEQRDVIRTLMQQIDTLNDPEIVRALQEDLNRVEEQFQKTFQEVKGLKITIGQRIKRFFFPKKASAKAVEIPLVG